MKNIVLAVLSFIGLSLLVCIYLIGGMAGVYAWNLAVFILAPIGVVAGFIQLIILAVQLCRRKNIKWNLIFLVLSLIFAYPVTVFLGISGQTYPDKARDGDEILVTMPVENAVLFGGAEYMTHAVWPSERYAYDILCEPYETGNDDLTSYGIYLKDVVAPVSGTVIGVENTEEDIQPNTEEFTSSYGNFIFLEIDGTGTYLILAHLEKGSITVSVGDHVTEGEVLAKVGNSGTTSEPHLHIQHQRNNPLDMICLTCSEGLPIKFK